MKYSLALLGLVAVMATGCAETVEVCNRYGSRGREWRRPGSCRHDVRRGSKGVDDNSLDGANPTGGPCATEGSRPA